MSVNQSLSKESRDRKFRSSQIYKGNKDKQDKYTRARFKEQENRRRNTILIDEHFSAIEKELEELINGTMAEFLVSCIDENKDIPLDVQIEIAFKELDVDNSGGLTVDQTS